MLSQHVTLTGGGKRKIMKRILLFALLLPMLADSEDIKVATWNLQFLNEDDNTGINPRDQSDYDRLADYAAVLDADIIALQEVDGANAIERVFDPAVYKVFASGRNSVQRTGFAVRQGIDVTQNPDFDALNTTGFLRRGTDITVRIGGTQLRLLSVHLKSGCVSDPLNTASDACQKLNAQVPVLESWINARASENTPYIVLGDWNRRFDVGQDFWPTIDDGKPRNADLRRVTRRQDPLCRDGQFDQFIDHIVFDRLSARWIKPYTFEQIVYQEAETLKHKLSDHCPIAVTLILP